MLRSRPLLCFGRWYVGFREIIQCRGGQPNERSAERVSSPSAIAAVCLPAAAAAPPRSGGIRPRGHPPKHIQEAYARRPRSHRLPRTTFGRRRRTVGPARPPGRITLVRWRRLPSRCARCARSPYRPGRRIAAATGRRIAIAPEGRLSLSFAHALSPPESACGGRPVKGDGQAHGR